MRQFTVTHTETGSWLYSSVNAEDRTDHFPIGYCGEPDHTHDTEVEARTCYRKWQRDHLQMHDEMGLGQFGTCAIQACQLPGLYTASIEGDGQYIANYNPANLCAEHNDVEAATIALGLADDQAADEWAA